MVGIAGWELGPRRFEIRFRWPAEMHEGAAPYVDRLIDAMGVEWNVEEAPTPSTPMPERRPSVVPESSSQAPARPATSGRQGSLWGRFRGLFERGETPEEPNPVAVAPPVTDEAEPLLLAAPEPKLRDQAADVEPAPPIAPLAEPRPTVKPSRLPKVPTRMKHRLRRMVIWEAIREKHERAELDPAISTWLNTTHRHLSASPDTICKIRAAGAAGLLKRGETSASAGNTP